MKLGQSMSYNKKNTFLLKFAENEGGKLVLDLLFQKKKRKKEKHYIGKSEWFAAQFQYISIALSLVYNKKTVNNLIQLITRYASFDVL